MIPFSPDTITTVLHFPLNGDLQSREELKPVYWGSDLGTSAIQSLMESTIQDSKSVFRKCRFNYLILMLDHYFKEKDDISYQTSNV